jgi:hypothetical protein
MTVNSLANFGVPGLNGDKAAVLQPILSNRFRALFFNFGATQEPAPYDLTRQIKRMGRPKLTYDIQTLYSYVSTVYINTRAEWNELTIEFFDDITNSVHRRVMNQNSKQQNFFDQTMSRAGENYKFEMDLDILAGGQSAGGVAADPNILQKWCFAGCQITDYDGGELTYESAEPMLITLTVRYDNVIGFDQNGLRMGVFSHNEEIQGQSGVAAAGTGAQGGLGISINGASVNVGFSGISLGGASVSGSVGTSGGSFGISF